MSIVDDLVANPGLYVGIDTVEGGARTGAARIVITPLPGNEGVELDYEIFNPTSPERVRGHVEHTVIGRTADGGAVMVVASGHAKSVHVMRETDHGVFEVVRARRQRRRPAALAGAADVEGRAAAGQAE